MHCPFYRWVEATNYSVKMSSFRILHLMIILRLNYIVLYRKDFLWIIRTYIEIFNLHVNVCVYLLWKELNPPPPICYMSEKCRGWSSQNTCYFGNDLRTFPCACIMMYHITTAHNELDTHIGIQTKNIKMNWERKKIIRHSVRWQYWLLGSMTVPAGRKDGLCVNVEEEHVAPDTNTRRIDQVIRWKHFERLFLFLSKENPQQQGTQQQFDGQKETKIAWW